MASIGKKILSAFVEVPDEETSATDKPVKIKQSFTQVTASSYTSSAVTSTGKFKQYFDKLFSDANLSGPDYFEFSKMTEAMKSISDERARYSAAFAGLSVQGLDKQKLLSTAAEYLRILETDANNFNSTVDAALKEKVEGKQKEIEEKTKRIEELTREINDLHNKIAVLKNEVKENEEKIENNSGSYKRESEDVKSKILYDIERIKEFI
jgi:peptidoglycan hydrolase CwlO-like protein